MTKHDLKASWETLRVVYYEDNEHKKVATMKEFFTEHPVYHFHKTAKFMGLIVAYDPSEYNADTCLPKHFAVISCTTLYWKECKKVIKWGLKNR